MSRRIAAALVLAALTSLAAQEPTTVDDQRSAWRYRREVTRPVDADGRLFAVPVPLDVQARSQPGLRDLRLVDASGREAPFLIHEDTARRGERRWTGRLTESQQERRQVSLWTVDFGEIATIDRLTFDVAGRNFSKRLGIEISADGAVWRALAGEFWVFDRPWQGQQVHATTIDIPRLDARFVRVSADDTRSRPIVMTGAVAIQVDTLAGGSWSEEAVLEPIGTTDGRTRYRVPVADGYPVRRLSLDADDPAFARRVTVVERAGDRDRTLGSGLAYRLRLPDEGLDLDGREIAVGPRANGTLFVEVADGDNPPLVRPRVRLSGPETRLIASTNADTLTMYYGNTVTRAASYDLEHLRVTLALVASYPSAAVGPETPNPRFRQPAPLSFVAARGAVIDAAAWRFSRPLRVTGDDDLYRVVVPPGDVARLRRDLGDLRLVDEAGRQVPYVMEREADVAPVALAVEPGRPRQDRRQTSAFRLRVPGTGRATAPLRFSAVRLRFAEPFFQRDAEVLVPRPSAPLGVERVAASRLAVTRREGVAEPQWVQVPLGDVTTAEFTIEIADGDNAPLTLVEAEGVAPVPRVTFKAGPGDYRLLAGNPDAAPPSYEIDALVQEVLAYAAVPLAIEAADMDANPAYERGVADVLREAPPRAVLWTALGMAVLVLLGLTVRVLRKTAE